MKSCCASEARRSLKRHRDVATCDTCGALLLAYGNPIDFERTKKELEAHGVTYECERFGDLDVIAKTRTDGTSPA